VDSSDLDALEAAIRHWLDRAMPGDYLGIHAYVPRSGTADLVLPAFQEALRERSQLAATAGYGPRFLHSTGQLHKGGPSGCRFLQIVDEPTEELPVPETDYSFRTLIRAQADGDLRALEQRGREVLRIRIPPAGHAAEAVEGQGDIPAGLSTILSILQGGIE
jgi:transaldolase/glucose-6-phosphate isomerase